ncbi:afadin [Cololabis saira]|uniref:afadin n=1 Tax=Cololabis saira TaxID=129043 RepID=UPI002AD51D94|nr:afadin [Cololabis saira]
MPETDGREKLSKVISQWNNERLDLFEISRPDENLEFHGVIRFCLEDRYHGNVATKCLRVSSGAPTREVIEVLWEKFRPDMKMLTTSYSLYEVHASKERKLGPDERPLLVQLSWTSGNRDGRFVLKRDEDGLEMKESCQEREKVGVIQSFKRTLSRKGKKKEKNNNAEDESGPCDLSGSETPGLPVGIQFSDEAEDNFLSAVVNYTNSSTVHFKLSPAYALYAAAHFALRRHGNAASVTSITDKMVAATGKVIQKQRAVAGALAFWTANSSELLNFLKHDEELGPLTRQSQRELSHLVHKAYSLLLHRQQTELSKHLPTFLIDPEEHGALPPGLELVLNTLMTTMALLRRCRVNAAFTIQLFSQLFHFTSTWLFNRLVGRDGAAPPGLRSHYWGAALRRRLSAMEGWAERQGLELAADCHLGRIVQATTLLTMKKYSVRDAKDIQSSCFKLNSLQLQMLLAGYVHAADEPRIPPDLIDAVVTAAESSVDHLIRGEGRDVRLQESPELRLPFLLPEGGYSCDAARGVPPGFEEFLEPLRQKGLCSLTRHPDSNLAWTVHFSEPAASDEGTYLAARRQPDTETVTLHKPPDSGMGVSIVAAKGAGQSDLGIYIKSIVRGGPAETDGRLDAGDQLLSVDGRSLVGLNQDRAAAIMMRTGPVVTLQVVKSGASYHGLEALLGEDGDRLKEGDGASTLYCVVDLGNKRSRQLYRSDPNVADFRPEDGDGRVDPGVEGNGATSASSVDLGADTLRREYLTLPNPKSRDKSVSEAGRTQRTLKTSRTPSDRTFLRQALSQEDLSVEGRRPLLAAQHAPGLYSSFPLRPSASAHDVLSDSPARTTAAGLWRTPFSQQATPTPSVQPVRIDIPLTRAGPSPPNPPLTTFQQSHAPQRRAPPTYACPVSAATKPSISPVKHVSFQQETSAVTARPSPRELGDPWRREAREQLEKRRALQAVERLGREMAALQAKARRSAEESGRLRRLSLEWQFQKRLREEQQDGEEEEEDEVVVQQPADRASPMESKSGNAREEDEANAGETSIGRKNGVRDAPSSEIRRRKMAPEKLPFSERQRLFSLPSSA